MIRESIDEDFLQKILAVYWFCVLFPLFFFWNYLKLLSGKRFVILYIFPFVVIHTIIIYKDLIFDSELLYYSKNLIECNKNDPYLFIYIRNLRCDTSLFPKKSEVPMEILIDD